MTTLTPYAAAKIVNEILVNLGVDKVLPPQMLYTYAKKGYIATQLVDGKIRITEAGLQEWVVKYVKKNFKIDITATAPETEEVHEDQMTIDEIETPEPSPEDVVMGK